MNFLTILNFCTKAKTMAVNITFNERKALLYRVKIRRIGGEVHELNTTMKGLAIYHDKIKELLTTHRTFLEYHQHDEWHSYPLPEHYLVQGKDSYTPADLSNRS